MQARDYDTVIDTASSVIRMDGTNATAYGLRASALEAKEEWESAFKDYNFISTMVPEHLPSHAGKGRCLAALGQVEPAVKIFQEILYTDPKLTIARLSLSDLLCQCGKPDEALSTLRDGLEQIYGKAKPPPSAKPKSGSAKSDVFALNLFLARLLLQTGADDPAADSKLPSEIKEALEAVDRAIAVDNTDPSAWLVRGACMSAVDDAQGAMESYRTGIEKCSGPGGSPTLSAQLHESLANAMYASKRFDDAIKCASDAIEIKPEHPRGYLIRGLAQAEKRLFGSAISDLTTFLDIVNENEEPQLRDSMGPAMYVRAASFLSLFSDVVHSVLKDAEAASKEAIKIASTEGQMTPDQSMELLFSVQRAFKADPDVDDDAGAFPLLALHDLFSLLERSPQYEDRAARLLVEMNKMVRMYLSERAHYDPGPEEGGDAAE